MKIGTISLAVALMLVGPIGVRADDPKPPAEITFIMYSVPDSPSKDLRQEIAAVRDRVRSNRRFVFLTFDPDSATFINAARESTPRILLGDPLDDTARQNLSIAAGAMLYAVAGEGVDGRGDLAITVYSVNSDYKLWGWDGNKYDIGAALLSDELVKLTDGPPPVPLVLPIQQSIVGPTVTNNVVPPVLTPILVPTVPKPAPKSAPPTPLPAKAAPPPVQSPAGVITAPALTPPAVTNVAPALPSPAVTNVAPALPSPAVTNVAPALPSPAVTNVAPALPSPAVTNVAPALPSPAVADVAPVIQTPAATTTAPNLPEAPPTQGAIQTQPAPATPPIAQVAATVSAPPVITLPPASPETAVATPPIVPHVDISPDVPSPVAVTVLPTPSTSGGDLSSSETSLLPVVHSVDVKLPPSNDADTITSRPMPSGSLRPRSLATADSDAATAKVMAGNAALDSSDLFSAIDDYRSAINLAPFDILIRIKLANVYIQAGLNKQAVDEARRALTLAPDNPDLHTFMTSLTAKGLIAPGDVFEQQADVSRNPDSMDAWLSLGDAYWNGNLPAKALDAYMTAEALNPGRPEPQARLARYYAANSQYDLALDALSKAGDAGYPLALKIITSRTDNLLSDLHSAQDQFAQQTITREAYYATLQKLDAETQALAGFVNKIPAPDVYRVAFLHRDLATKLIAQVTSAWCSYVETNEQRYSDLATQLEQEAVQEIVVAVTAEKLVADSQSQSAPGEGGTAPASDNLVSSPAAVSTAPAGISTAP